MATPNRDNVGGGWGRIKLVSLNIGGNSSTFGGMDRYLGGEEKADVIVLQEVRVQEQILLDLCKVRGYLAKVSLDHISGFGVAVVWRKTLPLVDYQTIQEGRIQFLDLGFGPIINVYGPAGKLNKRERRTFFGETLFARLASLSVFWVIGDFNCVLSRLDTAGNWKDKYCPVLDDIVKGMKLVDGYRRHNPQGEEYTWIRQGFHPSRLDRIIYPAAVNDKVISISHKASLSDHRALVVNMEAQVVNPSRRRFKQAYWKLNVSCLAEDECLQGLENIFTHSAQFKDDYNDAADWWEHTKSSITSFLKRYGARRARWRRDTTSFLYALLDYAFMENDFPEIERIKTRLKDLVLEDSWGVAIRSRVTSEIEDEAAGIYHLNQEKSKAAKCSLSQLKVGDNIVTERDKVLDEVMGFFKPLFEGRHGSGGVVNDTTFVQDESLLPHFLEGLPKLSSQSKRQLEQPITLQEYLDMVDKLPTNKSPGLDGLSYEFYKATKDFSSKPMVEAFNAILQRYRISISMETGAIRLVPKIKNGVPTVEQLRPITLLTCDYKMLTKILTSRLVAVLGEILVSGQIIGKKKGDINIVCAAENLVQSVFFAERTNAEYGLYSVDWWKAFDRVYIPYLLQVMKQMGFGKKFRKWIRMLHTGNKAVFILDGLSKPIDILFSVRQGDPIAMILYVIFLEPLLQKMTSVIEGVWVGGARLLHEPYADDISGCFKKGDLQKMAKLITQYERVSGALVNRDKCKVMGLGAWRKEKNFGVNLFKTQDSIKILGVWMYPTLTEIIRENWKIVTAKLSECLIRWKPRVLPTLKLRRMIVEVFGLSKIWFMAQILPLPHSAEEDIYSELSKFIWTGTHERLDLATLANPPKSGGVGLLSLRPKADSLYLATWVRIISRPHTSKYWQSARYWLGGRLQYHLPILYNVVHAFHRSILHAKVILLIKTWVKSTDPDAINLDNTSKLTQGEFLQQTSKSLYKLICPPPPKPTIEDKILGLQVEWSTIWKRQTCRAWTPKVSDIMLRLLHNVHPTKQRLFHTNNAEDEICQAEGVLTVREGPLLPDSRPLSRLYAGGPVQDRTHLFCECSRVINCWTWVRNVIVWELLPAGLYVMDEELLILSFPETQRSVEITWLIGVYVEWMWGQYRRRSGKVPVNELVPHLREVYRKSVVSGVLLDLIPPLR